MAAHPLRVLSLCSGYGGLDLAARLVFPGARTVCYIEREIPAVRVLAARMADGQLDSAPIWDDVTTFDPAPWAGAVDLIIAGFPCQPHSVAGKRQGTSDARWPVWDDIIRIARSTSAQSIFLENVPGLLTSSGCASIARVRSDLDYAGFANQAACILGACDVGASHRRDRLFILANSKGQCGDRVSTTRWQISAGGRRGGVAHSNGSRESQRRGNEPEIGQWASNGGYGIFAPGPDADWSTVDPRLWPATAQPALCGVVDGSADRLDISHANRLRMLGNGVVPLQAAAALRHLTDAMEDPTR